MRAVETSAAGRTDVERPAAGEVLDILLEVLAEAAASGDGMRVVGFGNLEPPRPHGTQSEDRRELGDRRFSGFTAQHGERVVTRTGPWLGP